MTVRSVGGMEGEKCTFYLEHEGVSAVMLCSSQDGYIALLGAGAIAGAKEQSDHQAEEDGLAAVLADAQSSQLYGWGFPIVACGRGQ